MPVKYVPTGWSSLIISIMHLVLMCQWFAPTKLHITFERDGLGQFTKEDMENVVVRDHKGEVVSLNLPTKFVLIANHQVRRPSLQSYSTPDHFAGLCRLGVCMVFGIFYWTFRSPPLYLHHPEEEFTVGADCWLGMDFAYLIWIQLIIDQGYAIIQLHFPRSFLGC
jgi:hypothetical protein